VLTKYRWKFCKLTIWKAILAFQEELISDGELWIEMIDSKNHSLYTYDINIAKQIISAIMSKYFTKRFR